MEEREIKRAQLIKEKEMEEERYMQKFENKNKDKVLSGDQMQLFLQKNVVNYKKKKEQNMKVIEDDESLLNKFVPKINSKSSQIAQNLKIKKLKE